MNFRICAAATALLAATTAPAAAEEAHPYVGALVGYDHVIVSDPYGSGSKDGVVYGGLAGIDFNLGDQGMIGPEAEITGASTAQTYALSGTESFRIKAGRDLYFGMRAGVIVAPHVLAYVKGGYTNSRITGRYVDTAGPIDESGSLDLNGWRAGAGAEVAMRRMRMRVEYRYSDYGQYTLLGVPTEVYTKRHQVVVAAIMDL